MVLKSKGYPKICASKIDNLICLRHLLRSKNRKFDIFTHLECIFVTIWYNYHVRILTLIEERTCVLGGGRGRIEGEDEGGEAELARRILKCWTMVQQRD